jgi:hypothetical protein
MGICRRAKELVSDFKGDRPDKVITGKILPRDIPRVDTFG